MSDTRIPPSLPPGSEPTARQNARKDGGDLHSVRLVSLPERLYDVRRAAIVRAEVIRLESDGTVRLNSSEGAITIRAESVAESVNAFQPGDSVEVHIPPGRPPETAEVRLSPPERSSPRSAQTDVDLQVSRRPDRAEGDSGTSNILAGRVVRAVPLSAEQAAQISQEPQEILAALLTPVSGAPSSVAIPAASAAASSQALVSVKVSVLARVQSFIPLTALPAAITGSGNAPLIPGLAPPVPATLTAPNGVDVGRVLKGALGLLPNGLQTPGGPDGNLPGVAVSGSFQVGNVTPPPVAIVPVAFDPLFPPVLFGAGEDRGSGSGNAASFPPPGLRAGEAAAQVLGPVAGKDALGVSIIFPAGADGEVRAFALLEPGVFPAAGTLVELSPLGGQLGVVPDAATLVSSGIAGARGADSPILTPPIAGVLASLPLGIPYFLNAETWLVLQELSTFLAQTSPHVAQAFTNMIPNPANPQQMAPAALFFIAAMRAGDIEGWLGGRAVDALRRGGRGDILMRLSQESSTLSRMGAEPLGQEWKATSLPLYGQEQILKIPVFYKRGQEERSENGEGGGGMVRFVINLDLSRMGKMQMDALYRESTRRFDLILRSVQPFTKAAEHEMRALFSGALEDLSLRGEMGFQSGAEKWVTVQPDKMYEFSQSF